jgi:endonuclease/exonuclease/phosphatase (EEP) superfamily protein YafD
MITWFVALATWVLATATLLPTLPFASGFVRVCDFPRLQIGAAALLLLALTVSLVPVSPAFWGLTAVQAAILAAQAAICLRFTPLHRTQSEAHRATEPSAGSVKILTANVKQSNRDFARLIRQIDEHVPDILLLMEVDRLWLDALAEIRARYPFRIEQPQENSYGMVVCSQLELIEPEILFRVLHEVPSARAIVALPSGERFRLHVLHPEPPVPYEDTLGRDSEVILVARDVEADSLPAVVAGDLNDVAWSRTTRRFQRLSGLLDPRVGRGLYNTFDARTVLLRWPLDHLFHDKRFRLASMQRLPDIGSDHFPMLFEIVLTPSPAADEAPGTPTADDRSEAREVTQEAAALDRKAIGSDWE